MMRPTARPSAFTLVEMLTALAVIAILLGLLIPAVMASRESGRRAECQNRLRQIGIALATHESSRGNDPTGARPELTKANGHTYAKGPLSTQFQLLPYFDQSALFNAINLSPGPPLFESIASCRANMTAANTRLDAFLCPSDGGSSRVGNNYRACNGSQPHEFDGSKFLGGDGAFPGFLYLSPRDFTDGLSRTVAFSERVLGGSSLQYPDRARDLWFSGLNSVALNSNRDLLYRLCGDPRNEVAEFSSKMGGAWIAANYANTLYNHVATPNWSGMDCADSLPPSDPTQFSAGIISARSHHRSGVNSLLMDGSVVFVGPAIALPVWRASGTRAAGESVASLE